MVTKNRLTYEEEMQYKDTQLAYQSWLNNITNNLELHREIERIMYDSEIDMRLRHSSLSKTLVRPWPQEFLERMGGLTSSAEDQYFETLDALESNVYEFNLRATLSKREAECIELVAAGFTRNQIAQMLQLKKGTINYYITIARTKFEKTNLLPIAN